MHLEGLSEATIALASIRPNESVITDVELAGPRQVLLQEIAESAPAVAAPKPRRWLALGLGGTVAIGAAAAAAVAIAVLPSSTTPAEPPPIAVPAPTASASVAPIAPPEVLTASLVLARAADHVTDPLDLLVSPGQYLRIEQINDGAQGWEADWSDDGDDRTFPFNGGLEPDGAILIRDKRDLYVPADRNADWTWIAQPQQIVQVYGERREDMLEDAARPEFPLQRTGSRLTAPAGEMPGRDGEGTFPLDINRPHYDTMPREPQALLEWYRAQSGMTGSAANRWVVSSMDAFTINLAPADVRAATFRALALIDGLEVTGHDEDHATIQYVADDRVTFTLGVDMKYGFLTSDSESFPQMSAVLPASVPSNQQRVIMSVVDGLPD